MKTKIIILVTLLLMVTGCGSSDYLKDEENNILRDPETGQTLRNDILCKPSEGTDIYNIYIEHEDQLQFSLEELPTCEDYNVNSNESSSLWQFIFVKPTAWFITSVGELVGNLGLAIIIVGLAIRILLLPIQIKNSKQTQNMRKANPEIKKLEEKYKNRKDQESQLAKSQEMLMIYKKYKINPATGCLLAFIQLPIFFAFLNAIYRIPTLYEQSLFGWNLGTTPSAGLQNGNYSYLFLLALVAVSTYFSFKYSMSQVAVMNDDMKKQQKMMMNVMTAIIIISAFNFQTALHFYWITTYAFIALQTYIIKRYFGEKEEKKENKKDKIKDKLDKKEGKKNGKISK